MFGTEGRARIEYRLLASRFGDRFQGSRSTSAEFQPTFRSSSSASERATLRAPLSPISKGDQAYPAVRECLPFQSFPHVGPQCWRSAPFWPVFSEHVIVTRPMNVCQQRRFPGHGGVRGQALKSGNLGRVPGGSDLSCLRHSRLDS